MNIDELVRKAIESAAAPHGVEIVYAADRLGGYGGIDFTRVLVSRDFVQVPLLWYRVPGTTTLLVDPLNNYKPAAGEFNGTWPAAYDLSDLRPFVSDASRGITTVKAAMDAAATGRG